MDIVGLGELLIDFAPMGERLYQANPGGSVPNMLVAAQRQGIKTAFIGKVGEDDFGTMLEGVLAQEGVDTQGVVFTQEASTTLAFVTLTESGERSFAFIRKPGADTLLRPGDVNYDLVDACRVFHFSALPLTDEPARGAALASAQYAREKGKTVAYDPNLRPLLWASLEEAKDVISGAIAHVDWLKISDEELVFITGQEDPERGSAMILERYPNVKLICITLGGEGCYYRSHGPAGTHHGHVPSYCIDVVDSTGAGDGFWGGMLAALLRSGMEATECWDREALERCVRIANVTGALACTQKGGIPSMPSLAEAEAAMNTLTLR